MSKKRFQCELSPQWRSKMLLQTTIVNESFVTDVPTWFFCICHTWNVFILSRSRKIPTNPGAKSAIAKTNDNYGRRAEILIRVCHFVTDQRCDKIIGAKNNFNVISPQSGEANAYSNQFLKWIFCHRCSNGSQFRESFQNAQQGKAKQMQWLWLWQSRRRRRRRRHTGEKPSQLCQ